MSANSRPLSAVIVLHNMDTSETALRDCNQFSNVIFTSTALADRQRKATYRRDLRSNNETITSSLLFFIPRTVSSSQ